MKYMHRYLKKHGQDCTIHRDPEVKTKVSMALATQSISDNREKFREGVILDEIQGGETFEVEGEHFVARSVARDYQGKTWSFLASKVNTSLTIKRYQEYLDSDFNPVKEWVPVATDIKADGQVVTATLRQQDPGLLPDTKWIFLMSNKVDLQLLDRLEFGDTKCQVDSIDDIRLPGILRVQCSDDLRD